MRLAPTRLQRIARWLVVLLLSTELMALGHFVLFHHTTEIALEPAHQAQVHAPVDAPHGDAGHECTVGEIYFAAQATFEGASLKAPKPALCPRIPLKTRSLIPPKAVVYRYAPARSPPSLA